MFSCWPLFNAEAVFLVLEMSFDLLVEVGGGGRGGGVKGQKIAQNEK